VRRIRRWSRLKTVINLPAGCILITNRGELKW
jgi:hypothetical protein